MKIVPLFLKADRATGGLGLNEKEIGLYYGIYGAAAFVPGSLLAGYYISARGLKKTLFSLCCHTGRGARGRILRRGRHGGRRS